MLAWCVATLEVNRELLAEEDLQRRGHTPFHPKGLVAIRVRGRRQFHERSYIPGYVFCNIETENDTWRTIRDAHGVREILMRGPDKPSLVPQLAMKLLLDACNGKYVKDFESLDRSLAKVVWPGADVVLPGLRNTSGKVTWTYQDRCRVMMKFLGHEREIEMTTNAVELRA